MPPWMIDQLEKERKARETEPIRPALRIEIPPPGWVPVKPKWLEEQEKNTPRGVSRIDFGGAP